MQKVNLSWLQHELSKVDKRLGTLIGEALTKTLSTTTRRTEEYLCVCVRVCVGTCLKEDLHGLRAGVFSRLVYGIVTIVARSTGACIKFCYL